MRSTATLALLFKYSTELANLLAFKVSIQKLVSGTSGRKGFKGENPLIFNGNLDRGRKGGCDQEQQWIDLFRY